MQSTAGHSSLQRLLRGVMVQHVKSNVRRRTGNKPRFLNLVASSYENDMHGLTFLPPQIEGSLVTLRFTLPVSCRGESFTGGSETSASRM